MTFSYYNAQNFVLKYLILNEKSFDKNIIERAFWKIKKYAMVKISKLRMKAYRDEKVRE